MTQTTKATANHLTATTSWDVANLTTSIRRTTGAQRDTYARALLCRVPIDLVAVLVGASDRYQAAEAASATAEHNLARTTKAIGAMIGASTDQTAQRAIDAVCTAARTYVHAIHHGDEDNRAQRLFLDSVETVTGMMDADEGRAEVPSLAWAAMALSMAEATERATKIAYRSIQETILDRLG